MSREERQPYRPSTDVRREIAEAERLLAKLRLLLAYALRQESIWAEDEHL